jgi:thiol-disulfide isomerase/thioredoxin
VGLDFVPTPRFGLIAWPVDGETVIVDPATGQATVLNGVASMIWGCLDGRTALGELVPDVAYAFDAPTEEVTQHLLAFGSDIARAGLLQDISAPPESVRSGRFPGGTGRSVLLANWNPSCGYCSSLAPQLATLSVALKEADVDVVLLATGEMDENVAFLERYRLDATVVIRPTQDFADPFPGLGTPAACLIGDDGVIREDFAVGAIEVAQLARRVAGQPEVAPADPGGRDHLNYLSAASSSGVCAPGAGRKPRRTWQRTSAYQVGGFAVGVRADSEATDDLLGRALAAYRVETREEPPAHLSLVMGGVKGALNLLLAGDETVVRSRSPRRVLHALATYLSMLVDQEEGTLIPNGLWAVTALPTIVGDASVLLPARLRSALAAAQPRLARAEFRLVDTPLALMDPLNATLVVPPPRVELDLAALDDLPGVAPTASEGAWVPPGRYPMVAWALGAAPSGDRDVTMATAVATAIVACTHPDDSPEAALASLTGLFGHVAALPLSGSTLGEVIENLARRISVIADSDTLVGE